MARAVSMGIHVPGCEVWVEYNPNNNRILRVEWTIPVQGVVVRALVWNNDVLVVDRTEGQGSGSQNVPGNLLMVEVTDEFGTYMDLPPNIRYEFHMNTIGQIG